VHGQYFGLVLVMTCCTFKILQNKKKIHVWLEFDHYLGNVKRRGLHLIFLLGLQYRGTLIWSQRWYSILIALSALSGEMFMRWWDMFWVQFKVTWTRLQTGIVCNSLVYSVGIFWSRESLKSHSWYEEYFVLISVQSQLD
jgi:hypothetical protein